MRKKIKDTSKLSVKELVNLYAKESRELRNAGRISVIVGVIALIAQILALISIYISIYIW